MKRYGLLALLAGFLAVACGPVDANNNNVNHNYNTYNNNNAGTCTAGQIRCSLSTAEICQGGTWVTQQVCQAPTPGCTAGIGCTVCSANQNYCDGDHPRSCDATGQPAGWLTPCGSGETCSNGSCTSPCATAQATNSYIGCEYWPTPASNGGLDLAFGNNFGVVVHNANPQPAQVTISRNGSEVAQQDVPAGQLHTFQLPIDTGLKGDLNAGLESLKVGGAAFHLTSTLPVTVYQFNPLDFQVNSTCQRDGSGPPCYSYSNDASLLLPTHVLSENYIVTARQSFGVEQFCDPVITDFFDPNYCPYAQTGTYSFIPGYVTIVGTENNTTVTVTSSANTEGGDFGAFTPGSSQTFTIGQGEAIQIVSGAPANCTGAGMQHIDDDCGQPGGGRGCSYCDAGANYDLTGTVISASARVAVYAGHDCSFVPYNTWACDHLEEQMMPLETWGKDFIVGRTKPQNDTSTGFNTPEPNVVRVVSGSDGNTIAFDPAQAVGGAITLNKGQWVEFLATEDFHVSSSGAISVAQYLVGQNYYTTNYEYHGDPAFALNVPVEQFRTSYSFLAPATVTYNYLNIIKRVNEGSPPVYLDGTAVPESEFTQRIGGTEWGVARIAIQGTGHTIECAQPVGIMVYGFARYTSYMYPGGLDLKFINPVE
jgi:hypothetical protein